MVEFETNFGQCVWLVKFFDKREYGFTEVFWEMVETQGDAEVHKYFVGMGWHCKWKLADIGKRQFRPNFNHIKFVVVNEQNKGDDPDIGEQADGKNCTVYDRASEYLLVKHSGECGTTYH